MTTDSSKKVDEIMALAEAFADSPTYRAALRTALESAVIDPAAVREAIARELDADGRQLGANFVRQIPLDKLRGE